MRPPTSTPSGGFPSASTTRAGYISSASVFAPGVFPRLSARLFTSSPGTPLRSKTSLAAAAWSWRRNCFSLPAIPNGQANLLDQFFLSRPCRAPRVRGRAMSWLKAIEAQRGMVSILELSRLSGLSVRSVDRLFQQVIGLPPKFVARTVRFRHALHHLMAQPATRSDGSSWPSIFRPVPLHPGRQIAGRRRSQDLSRLSQPASRRAWLQTTSTSPCCLRRDGSKAPACRCPARLDRPPPCTAGRARRAGPDPAGASPLSLWPGATARPAPGWHGALNPPFRPTQRARPRSCPRRRCGRWGRG